MKIFFLKIMKLTLGLLLFMQTFLLSFSQPFRQEKCSFMANSGPCNGHYNMFAFDSTSNRCVEFVYSGCGGNPNRFVRKSECIEICQALLDDEAELQNSSEELNPLEILGALPTKIYKNKSITSFTIEEEFSPSSAEPTTQPISNKKHYPTKPSSGKINPKPISKLTKAMTVTAEINNFIVDLTKAPATTETSETSTIPGLLNDNLSTLAETSSKFSTKKKSPVREPLTIYNFFNLNPFRTKSYLKVRVNN